MDIEKALNYVEDSIEQCDSTHTYERIVGIIDFLAYMKIITTEQNMDYRNKLSKVLQQHCL